jgi:preprotein translocase subunit SecA
MMQALNIPEDMPIESKIVTKAHVSAQKKVEGLNFDARKHFLIMTIS